MNVIACYHYNKKKSARQTQSLSIHDEWFYTTAEERVLSIVHGLIVNPIRLKYHFLHKEFNFWYNTFVFKKKGQRPSFFK